MAGAFYLDGYARQGFPVAAGDFSGDADVLVFCGGRNDDDEVVLQDLKGEIRIGEKPGQRILRSEFCKLISTFFFRDGRS